MVDKKLDEIYEEYIPIVAVYCYIDESSKRAFEITRNTKTSAEKILGEVNGEDSPDTIIVKE